MLNQLLFMGKFCNFEIIISQKIVENYDSTKQKIYLNFEKAFIIILFKVNVSLYTMKMVLKVKGQNITSN